MRRVTLQGTEINVSRLSFGTASLHHLSTSRGRQNLLAATFDHGFTHFDTAPYYGFGICEEELGRFLKGRRSQLTVATKVGLYPPGGIHPNTFSVWIRKGAGKLLPALSRPVIDWSIAAASSSLDRSLRRLGIEQIDLLLLHDPDPVAVQSELFLNWLKKKQAEGRIRAWGLAGNPNTMNTWLSSNSPLGMVLQVRDSLDRREADLITSHGRDLQITYGYLSSSATPYGVTGAAETLRQAFRRNASGSILLSTRQLARVGELAAVEEMDDGENI